MTGVGFLAVCITISLAILCLALAMTTFRVIRGPTLPDRVLALDTLTTISIGIIAVLGIKTGAGYHVDIAIALGLVAFLATVAFARFVSTRGPSSVDPDPDTVDAEREASEESTP